MIGNLEGRNNLIEKEQTETTQQRILHISAVKTNQTGGDLFSKIKFNKELQ